MVDRLVNGMKGITERQCCCNHNVKVSIERRAQKQRDKLNIFRCILSMRDTACVPGYWL